MSHSVPPPLQPTGLPQQNFMHVSNPSSLAYSPGGGSLSSQQASQALAAATAALTESGMLSTPHGHLQRNVASPQRPASAGSAGVCVCACLSVSPTTCIIAQFLIQ